MKRISAVCALAGFVLIVIPQVLDAGWMRTYGTAAYEEGRSVAQTSDGGFVIVGKTGNSLWILRTNPQGDTLWTRTIDEASPSSVIVTSDGGYLIAGSLNSEWTGQSLYLLKTDSQGNTEWSKSHGRDVCTGQYSAPTAEGGYVVVGSSTKSKLWVLKTNSSGDTLWTREFGNKGSGLWVKEAGDGYVVIGYVQLSDSIKDDLCVLKVGSDGDTLWMKTYGLPGDYERGSDAVETSDGGFIITGKKGSSLWLLKTSSTGDTLWSYQLPNANGYGVADAGDGGVVVTGMVYSGLAKYDLLLLKTSSQGSQVWKRTYGGGDDEWGYSIKKCTQGGYIIAGLTKSIGAGDYDLWLLRTNASGDTSVVCEDPQALPDLSVISPVGQRIVLRFRNCHEGFNALVYDASGRKVDELNSSSQSGTCIWGENRAPGVYFILSESKTAMMAQKVILIR